MYSSSKNQSISQSKIAINPLRVLSKEANRVSSKKPFEVPLAEFVVALLIINTSS